MSRSTEVVVIEAYTCELTLRDGFEVTRLTTPSHIFLVVLKREGT